MIATLCRPPLGHRNAEIASFFHINKYQPSTLSSCLSTSYSSLETKIIASVTLRCQQSRSLVQKTKFYRQSSTSLVQQPLAYSLPQPRYLAAQLLPPHLNSHNGSSTLPSIIAACYHTASVLNRRPPDVYNEFLPPEPEVVIDGDIVPQSRLDQIFAHINEDVNVSPMDVISNEIEQKFIVNEVLSIGRHTKILPGGRLMTFSALVMLGTGLGCAGIGRARGETVALAVQCATAAAKKNIISINRFRGCTITRDSVYKFKRTKVIVRACRTGYGVHASPEMRLVLKAFGLQDICITAVGRTTNRQAMYRALFKGFQTEIILPQTVAKCLGKKMFDVHAFYYNSKA